MIRPRFSLRSLLALITLIGFYFGSWELTKRLGVEPIEIESLPFEVDADFEFPFDSSPAPFVVSRFGKTEAPDPAPTASSIGNDHITAVWLPREHHLWFFGYTAKLIERAGVAPEGWDSAAYDDQLRESVITTSPRQPR
ncbi:MAG: hypothetical protein QGG36_15540 [Pirellulaceae bacterium]|jgi:hypothetical protein|nr:hypothetical protein [Pirellulaceae bacterium]MDP7017218.1 hypothetical protein [Pirellulaceae bacterium]